ncbi:MAG: HEAT repeat domain-containing protein [Planctomycetes bacterium]|nr:HEAT repeat domain-containing protein [Planctomycetota bacterium]
MSISNPKKVSLAVAAAVAVPTVAGTARNKGGVYNLMSGIRDDDAGVRTKAWQSAGQVGAAAIEPLAEVMVDKELEVARAAKRGLWKIVRHAGRPGAADEKKAVVGKLIELLGDEKPVPVRREVLWMLSEIGNRNSIKPIAALLSHRELCEDARMALQRIPNKAALAALKAALEAAPDEFKLNIAQSLRQRGVEVPGLDCKKLIPTKKTNVKPL